MPMSEAVGPDSKQTLSYQLPNIKCGLSLCVNRAGSFLENSQRVSSCLLSFIQYIYRYLKVLLTLLRKNYVPIQININYKYVLMQNLMGMTVWRKSSDLKSNVQLTLMTSCSYVYTKHINEMKQMNKDVPHTQPRDVLTERLFPQEKTS